MTREIKFRAKSLDGNWEYGELHLRCNHPHMHNLIRAIYIDPETIGQYTGLHDKNGKEIYEGDIIQRMHEMEVGKGQNRHVESAPFTNDTPKVIDFRDGAFGYVNFYESTLQYEEWLPLMDELCEVIGNIYDNPELLPKEE